MDRGETIKFYEECMALGHKAGCEKWNNWANGLLAEKKQLQESGEWEAKKDDWEDRARVNFDNYKFDKANFREFIFPSYANFSKLIFPGNTSFLEVTFPDNADFHNATFTGYADFMEAKFSGNANFSGATFTGNALFNNATFTGDADFWKATFSGVADFMGAKFSIILNEKGDEVGVSETAAIFMDAVFEKLAAFYNAIFKNEASFKAINSKAGFDLGGAEFAIVPIFIQAHFLEAPSLDDVEIPEDAPKGSKDNSFTARYRSLKRMAIQAHDHEREQNFFAGELKSMRTGKWFSKGWTWRLFGYLYEIFSNFGRSFFLPVIWWLFSTFWFFRLYLFLQPQKSLFCINGDSIYAAIGISLSKALFPLGNFSDSTPNLYACLYGVKPAFGAAGQRLVPDIPIELMAVETLQSLISIILIFFMLLAIRAHFRIK